MISVQATKANLGMSQLFQAVLSMKYFGDFMTPNLLLLLGFFTLCMLAFDYDSSSTQTLVSYFCYLSSLECCFRLFKVVFFIGLLPPDAKEQRRSVNTRGLVNCLVSFLQFTLNEADMCPTIKTFKKLRPRPFGKSSVGPLGVQKLLVEQEYIAKKI